MRHECKRARRCGHKIEVGPVEEHPRVTDTVGGNCGIADRSGTNIELHQAVDVIVVRETCWPSPRNSARRSHHRRNRCRITTLFQKVRSGSTVPSVVADSGHYVRPAAVERIQANVSDGQSPLNGLKHRQLPQFLPMKGDELTSE